MKTKKKAVKKITAFFMALVMCFSTAGATAYAQEGITEVSATGESMWESWDGVTTEDIYAGENFNIVFSLASYWDGGYNVNVEIQNTGDEAIENWALEFDLNNAITSMWNAGIESSDKGRYVVKNAGWNADIAARGSASFGFGVNENFNGFPSAYRLLGEKVQAEKEAYTVEYVIDSDWGEGFTGRILITNRSEKSIEDWILEFDFERKITELWNGVIEKHEGNHYVIKNAGYNATIPAGETISFGFSGTQGDLSTKPEAVELRQIAIKNEVAGDMSDKEKDTDGDGLPDYLEEIYGTSPMLKDTDGDGLSDALEIYYGLNPLVDDSAMDFDGDGLTTEEELKYGTSILLADTDGDELSDFEEIMIYHTDPLAEDSDGDGLDDGAEIRMGFSPLQADSNGNGIPDGKEKVPQTKKIEFAGEEKNAILSVEVAMAATGEVERTTRIKNVYGIDSLSSEVVGLVGVPVDITTQSEFDEAVITFRYDERALGETAEENLRIMWYDEENNQYIIFDEDTVLDTENNTVSYKTTHFSTYLVVDKEEWYKVWNNAVVYNRKPSSSYATQYIDLCFLIDTSGSMSGTYINTAKESVRYFIEAMYSSDRAAIVGFESNATIYQELTSEKTALNKALDRIIASGGTSVEKGLVKALDLFPVSTVPMENQNARVIVLLCDGDVYYTQSTLNRAKSMGVKIFPVLIGSTYGRAALQTIADTTGGKLYYAATAEEIRKAIYGVQGDTIGELDTTDTDGDGLYDIYEIAGMMLPNGTVVYSDPEKWDTDGDTIPDGVEMGVLTKFGEQKVQKKMSLVRQGFEHTIYAEYFDYQSDPNERDTDGDDYEDQIDAKPRVQNSNAIYIFYEEGGDWFLKSEANSRRKAYEKKGEKVFVIGTSSRAEFIDAWNDMGLDGNGKYLYTISDVYTVYHGRPNGIVVGKRKNSNQATQVDEWIYLNDLASLQAKKIGALYLSSCNTGNIDWINDGKWGKESFEQNMAIRFLKEIEGIDKVIAWDGNAVYVNIYLEYSPSPSYWDLLRGKDDFSNWSIAKNGYLRLSNEKVTYDRDDSNEKQIRMSARFKFELSLSDPTQMTPHEIKEVIQ